MIQRAVVGLCCFVVGFSLARPMLAGKGHFVPGMRPACAEKTLTFCEKVENYPSELIAKLLKSAKFDVGDFIVDESDGLDEPPEYVLNAASSDELENESRKTRSLETRADEDELAQRCSLPTRMAVPRIASNSRGEWRFIAQEESLRFQQKVKIHICKDSKECQKSCTQFYAPVPLKSLSQNRSLSNQEVFWVPSSCHCYKNSENLL